MKTRLLLLAVLLLASCSGNRNSAENENHTNPSHNAPLMQVKNSNPRPLERESGQRKANHLTKLAESVPNVENARAVVLGPYAIVGIDVNPNIDRSQVGSIKYSVAESLKHDPYGSRAVVVADPDMNARLREIQMDIRNGRPIQGIMNELSDIVGRVMPEIPNQIVEPKNPDRATEHPKRNLPDRQDHKLEKEQQDQSNQMKNR
ncbi:MAG: YhcN/YlaJ family sporulation lipoprotein [Bacillales bacterium]|nr:YhcN/YlaJ family sporulation lipoprotein [Bacillales bacterium]